MEALFESSRMRYDFGYIDILAPIITGTDVSHHYGELSKESLIATTVATGVSIAARKINVGIHNSADQKDSPANYLIKAKKVYIINQRGIFRMLAILHLTQRFMLPS